jgi:hypothetical protein
MRILAAVAALVACLALGATPVLAADATVDPSGAGRTLDASAG